VRSPPPLGPAIAAAGTRSALRLTGVAVGSVLALGVAVVGLAALLLRTEWRADDLAANGARTSGVVTKVGLTYSGRERQPHGQLTVRYPSGGTTRTARVEVGTDITDFHRGDDVTVVYDRHDPDRIQVAGADDPNRNGAWIAPAVIGGALLLLSGFATARLRRTRRIVRSHPWRAIPARLRSLPPTARGRSRTVLELYGQGDEPRVVADTRGIRPLVPELEPVAWVAGDAERFVFAPPGGRPVFAARRLREE
jgi:hypothetical protein